METVYLEKLARLKNAPEVKPEATHGAPGPAGHIILFRDDHFNGDRLEFWAAPGWGNPGLPGDWNDSVTSIIVESGVWALSIDANYSGQRSVIGPGAYPGSDDFGLPNDSLTSLTCLAA